MKAMKYLTPPTKVVFIEPHKYVCTNSKGEWWNFEGLPLGMDFCIVCQ
jgi:hypothetical protein